MKKLITITAIVLFLSSGCTTQSKNHLTARHTPMKLDPVLSEDKTDEAVPLRIPISVNTNNFDVNYPVASSSIQDIFDQTIDLCSASQDFWQKGDIDNALQSLDNAYSLLLNVHCNKMSKHYQQKENLRLMISRRIQEIYASQHTAVKGSHAPIPIVINKEVQYEIDSFTGRERNFFAESLKRSGRYRPMMVSKLKEAGLPEELSWLPLVESGYKVRALSTARALGLWQFIPSTGHMYGLKRDTYVDERLDPEKSTAAAIAYLKTMHKMFGDWTTVLAAYNCGEGRVLGTIRRQNINYLDNFWDLYRNLPSETARYVPRFIATVHIINNLKKYGFDDIDLDQPMKYEKVAVEKSASLKDIATLLDVCETTMKDLNPELRHLILPKTSYELNIPPGKADALYAGIDSLQNPVIETRQPQAQRPRFVYHRVKSGETLSSISNRYKVPTRTLAQVNRLSKKNHLRAGQVLTIPRNGSAVRPVATTSSTKSQPSKVTSRSETYIVKQGDSLWKIAEKYGTTVAAIEKHNGMKRRTITNGQALKIPTTGSKAQTSVYRVKAGDNPLTIANKYNMSVSKLLKLNQLKSSSKIYPGQNLFVE